MRLAHASATLLMAGSLSLSAWANPQQPPYQTQAVVQESLVQGGRAELDIELAWLADPVAFPCQLSAHFRGGVFEISGVVPNDKVRQHVLTLAGRYAGTSVEDKLVVLPGSTLPIAACNRDMLCRTAVTRMAKRYGQYGLSFDITVDAGGQIVIAGSIPTREEKLDVSRRLSQLPGCSAVINKLDVNPLARNFKPVERQASLPQTLPTSLPPASPQVVESAPVVTQVTLAAPRPVVPTQPVTPAPKPVALAPVKPPVQPKPSLTMTADSAPVSPYAQSSKTAAALKANLGNPQPAETARSGWGPAPIQAVAAAPAKPNTPPTGPTNPQTTQQTQRTGSALATAGTPSGQRTPGPVAMAGTPSTGPRPAAMPRDAAAAAQPIPEARSFVPARPPVASSAPAPNSGLVPANLQHPAYVTPRAQVVPTSHQEVMPSGPRPMPQDAARPMPAGQPTPNTMPKTQVTTAPANNPARQVAPTAVAQATVPPKLRPGSPAVTPAPKNAEPASPYGARPQPKTMDVATNNAPAPKPIERATPYGGRQPVTAAPVPTEVRPVSASQPVAAVAPKPMVVEPTPTPQAAPNEMPIATSSPRVTTPVAPAPRPMPTERMTGRPNSPDITPGLISHLRQRIHQIGGGRARDVELQKIGSDRLKISLAVSTPQEGEQLASKILAITELAPFQVDVEVRLAQ